MNVSMEGSMEQGNYEKAYDKAKTDDEKKAVKVENFAAVHCAMSIDALKDPSSFVLRDVYYDECVEAGENKPYLVLYISGTNSYGARVSMYWLYGYGWSEGTWSYLRSVTDLNEEEYGKYDSQERLEEKAIDNYARKIIKLVKGDGYKLNKDGVDRINNLFKKDKLGDVKLLDFE